MLLRAMSMVPVPDLQHIWRFYVSETEKPLGLAGYIASLSASQMWDLGKNRSQIKSPTHISKLLSETPYKRLWGHFF